MEPTSSPRSKAMLSSILHILCLVAYVSSNVTVTTVTTSETTSITITTITSPITTVTTSRASTTQVPISERSNEVTTNSQITAETPRKLTTASSFDTEITDIPKLSSSQPLKTSKMAVPVTEDSSENDVILNTTVASVQHMTSLSDTVDKITDSVEEQTTMISTETGVLHVTKAGELDTTVSDDESTATTEITTFNVDRGTRNLTESERLDVTLTTTVSMTTDDPVTMVTTSISSIDNITHVQLFNASIDANETDAKESFSNVTELYSTSSDFRNSVTMDTGADNINSTEQYVNESSSVVVGYDLASTQPYENVTFTTESPLHTEEWNYTPTTQNSSEIPQYDYQEVTASTNSSNSTTQTSIPTTWAPPIYVTFILKTTLQKFCEESSLELFRLTVFKLMDSAYASQNDVSQSPIELSGEHQITFYPESPCEGHKKDKLDKNPEFSGPSSNDKTVMDKEEPTKPRDQRGAIKDYKVRQRRSSEETDIPVSVVVDDDKGYYSYPLTRSLAELLNAEAWPGLVEDTPLVGMVSDVKIHGSQSLSLVSPDSDPTPAQWRPSTGVVVGIVVGAVAALVIIGFIVMQLVIMRRRRCVKKMRHSYENRYSIDTLQGLGVDAIQLTGVRLTSNHWGYVNPALVIDDKDFSSNPLNFTALTNIVKSSTDIDEEFLMLPNYVSRVTDIPLGAEDKNRYANVVPVPETRVPLSPGCPSDDCLDYINANYVRGYLCAPKSYIATQAPLDNTREDFWRMVYEQRAQAVLMLTALTEQGASRCVEYWPNTDGGDTSRQYGQFSVTLERREIRPAWITSQLTLAKMGSAQSLSVTHFWLTSWPPLGLPDPRTILGFLLSARPYMEKSIGPTVVHCSPGTGRTGVMIAVDTQMSAFDDAKLVDILSCVAALRQDRAGLVQNREQYGLIYRTVLEYAQAIASTEPSRASSIGSLHVGPS